MIIDTTFLIGFILIEGITIGISKGFLEIVNKELLKNALDMGYKLNNKKRIFDTTIGFGKKDKIFLFLSFIPFINMIVYAYKFYFKNSDNKELIANHIKNKVLVEMNEAEKEYFKNHKGVEDIDLIQEGKIIMVPNSSEATKEEVLNNSQNEVIEKIRDLKDTVLDITKEDIDENEKNQKIVELLKEYEIIPSDSKVKKLKR